MHGRTDGVMECFAFILLCGPLVFSCKLHSCWDIAITPYPSVCSRIVYVYTFFKFVKRVPFHKYTSVQATYEYCNTNKGNCCGAGWVSNVTWVLRTYASIRAPTPDFLIFL